MKIKAVKIDSTPARSVPSQGSEFEQKVTRLNEGDWADPYAPWAEPVARPISVGKSPSKIRAMKVDKAPAPKVSASASTGIFNATDDLFAKALRAVNEKSKSLKTGKIDKVINAIPLPGMQLRQIPLVRRLHDDMIAGAIGTVSGMAGSIEWMTGSKAAKEFGDLAETFRDRLTPEDPNFADKLAQGGGSMAAFFIPGIGVSSTVGRLSMVAPKVAAWLGVGVASALEAMTESGSTYRDVLQNTQDKDEASSAASKVFWLNMVLLPITNKLGVFGDTGKFLRRTLTSSLMEGSQEGAQELIQTWAEKRKLDWKQVLESTAIGAIIGGGVKSVMPSPLIEGGVEGEEDSSLPPETTQETGAIAGETEKPQIRPEFGTEAWVKTREHLAQLKEEEKATPRSPEEGKNIPIRTERDEATIRSIYPEVFQKEAVRKEQAIAAKGKQNQEIASNVVREWVAEKMASNLGAKGHQVRLETVFINNMRHARVYSIPPKTEAIKQEAPSDISQATAEEAPPKAIFKGYQFGTEPMFNIKGGGKLDGSSVGVKRLEELGIPVPPIPPVEDELRSSTDKPYTTVNAVEKRIIEEGKERTHVPVPVKGGYVGMRKDAAGQTIVSSNTTLGAEGNIYIETKDGTRYESKTPLHAMAIKEFKLNYEDIAKTGVVGKTVDYAQSKTLLSAISGQDIAQRSINHLKSTDQAKIINALAQLPSWMKEAGADPELLKKLDVHLKPIVEIPEIGAETSLNAHSQLGQIADKVLGSTTFSPDGLFAMMQLSLDQGTNSLKRTTIHETYHALKAWTLPRVESEQLSKYFSYNTEAEAISFADYIMGLEKARGNPNFIQRSWAKIKALLDRIYNGLRGMGFTSEPDVRLVWDNLRQGVYNTRQIADLSQVGLGTTAFSGEVPWAQSHLSNVVSSDPQLPKKADSVINYLKRKGVKDVELKWMGVEDWLSENRDKDGKIDRQEFSDWVNGNKVRVEEVVKEEDAIAQDYVIEEFDKALELAKKKNPWLEDTLKMLTYTPREIRNWVSSILKNEVDLQTAVNSVIENAISQWEEFGYATGYDIQNAVYLTEEEVPDVAMNLAVYGPQSEFQATLPGGEQYHELLLTFKPPYSEFQSPHWTESNVLAHVRFNSRVDTEGNNVLFLEEVQSDWMQRAAKEGFSEGKVAKTGQRYSIGKGPPSAPFLSNWPEVSLKRMIRWAAENGYDRLAWTKGVTQVERWSTTFRRKVKKIEWRRHDLHPKTEVNVVARMPNDRFEQFLGIPLQGEVTIQGQKVTLDSLLGSEMANEIRNSGQASGEFIGEELTIGGQGMHQFYDRLLPGFLKKYGKQWGAKVGETEVITPEPVLGPDKTTKKAKAHYIDITDSMRSSVINHGQTLFSLASPPPLPPPLPKSAQVSKIRQRVDSMVDDFLQPIEGSPLDKGAVAYMRSDGSKIDVYFDNMPAIGELSPAELYRYDLELKKNIATYKTPKGEIKPAIRQSGFFVLNEFEQSFKDAKDISKTHAMWVDPTRLIQSIDQGYFDGYAQRYILHPARMTTLAKMKWSDYHKKKVNQFAKDYHITNKKRSKVVSNILEHINSKDAWSTPVNEILTWPGVRNDLRSIPRKHHADMVNAAIAARKHFDQLLANINKSRKLRKQTEIKKRINYIPDIIEQNAWSTAFGLKNNTEAFKEKPEMPDFIQPNQPFNARALVKEGVIDEKLLEKDIVRLLADYIDTAAKDIFDTNIIHNNKIHAAVLKSQDLLHSADAIETWTAEVFAGTLPTLSRGVRKFVPSKGLNKGFAVRRNLVRAVFPLNFSWNAFIQTSSAGITLARYGVKANVFGLSYIFDPVMRRAIRSNAYSSIIKSRWGGRLHYQDVQDSITKNKRLQSTKFDNAIEYANFLTSTVEDLLTGHAIAAAYYHGKKLGLSGRALWEYASEGGAKTQSMYNYEDIPGLLRAREVGALIPFQTFCFEVFNTVREMNIPIVRKVIGQAGTYETTTAQSRFDAATTKRRLGMLARWIAAIILTNAVGDTMIGRKPWTLSSFVPFLGYLTGNIPVISKYTGAYSGKGPIPHEYIKDFVRGWRYLYNYGDFKRLRQWILRYHAPAGVQLDRFFQGIESLAKEKVTAYYTTPSGEVRERVLFEVDRENTEEVLRTLVGGPYRTKSGIEYFKEKGKRENEKVTKRKARQTIKYK